MVDTPIVSLKSPEQGMPPHPFLTDRPVIWADPGDKWLFRLTTNVLVPKAIEELTEKDALVRYTTCAIKRSLEHGGGVDYVLWVEIEEIQPETKTSLVVPILCSGPSRAEHKDVVKKEVEAFMIAFQQQYKNPRWIVQFDNDGDFAGVQS